jgi:hypothetical protein
MSIDNDSERVRLLIGDTNEDDPILYDDEIQECIDYRSLVDDSGGTTSVNVLAAAADAAGAAAAKYARDFDFSEDGQNFQRAQRVGHYMNLERELRNRSGGIAVSLGGTAIT